jgi:hypothetical protein
MTRWLHIAALVLLIAHPAAAQTSKLAILPFTGPNAAAARKQLVSPLCQQAICVPAARVGKGAVPDWRRVRQQELDLLLTGRVSGPATKRILTLTGYARDGEQRFSERYTLARNGLLTRTGLQGVQQQVQDALEQVAAAQPPARPEIIPMPEEEPDPTPDPDQFARDEPPPVVTVPRRVRHPLVVGEGHLTFLHRSFSYRQLAEQNLRAYQTQPLMVAPAIRAAVYPLSRLFDDWMSGLALEGGYRFALGLRSLDENDQAYDTTFRQVDVGARLDLYPLEGSQLMVAPQLGYRRVVFEVGPSPDGTRLLGLPDLDYRLVRVGVEVEAPFEPFLLFCRAAYLQALDLGEIATEAFFPDSWGNAVELELGGGYELLPGLQMRASLHYTRYGLYFSADPQAVYRAEGAADQYVGGSLGLRYAY